MSKGLKIFLNILYTIIAVPFGILGAICIAPFAVLGLLIFIPVAIIEDIWGFNPNEYAKLNSERED